MCRVALALRQPPEGLLVALPAQVHPEAQAPLLAPHVPAAAEDSVAVVDLAPVVGNQAAGISRCTKHTVFRRKSSFAQAYRFWTCSMVQPQAAMVARHGMKSSFRAVFFTRASVCVCKEPTRAGQLPRAPAFSAVTICGLVALPLLTHFCLLISTNKPVWLRLYPS